MEPRTRAAPKFVPIGTLEAASHSGLTTEPLGMGLIGVLNWWASCPIRYRGAMQAGR